MWASVCPHTNRKGLQAGRPNAPYLFLIAAEVLSILIKTNTDKKGIKLGNKEYKITQFVDDTTIILDGERDSLQLALNVLEFFDWGSERFTLLGIEFSVDLSF